MQSFNGFGFLLGWVHFFFFFGGGGWGVGGVIMLSKSKHASLFIVF